MIGYLICNVVMRVKRCLVCEKLTFTERAADAIASTAVTTKVSGTLSPTSA